MKHFPGNIEVFLPLVCLSLACGSSTKGTGGVDAPAQRDTSTDLLTPDAAVGADDIAPAKPDTVSDLASPGSDTADLVTPRPDTAPDLLSPGPDAAPDLASPKSDAAPDLARPDATPSADVAPDLAKPDTTSGPDATDLATPKPDATPDLTTPKPDAPPDATVVPDSATRFDALASRCVLDGAAPSLVHLSPQELKTLLDAGEDMFLINVKGTSIDEIPGTDATLANDIAGIEALVGNDLCANIVLYCQGGGTSQSVGSQLIAKGYRHVRDLSGGITAWKAAGYPTQ